MRLHPEPRPRTDRRGHALLIFRSLLEILILCIFVSTFIIEPSHIPSSSMWPTLRPGDMLLADNQTFAPEGRFAPLLPPTAVRREDVAIFHFPLDPKTDLVKRIIGLPGDRIRLREGRVELNGVRLAEPYAVHSASPADLFRDEFPSLRSVDPEVDPAWWASMRRRVHGEEIVVPPDSFFVLGDNRDESEDSRYWGFVPREMLVGRPLVVYLPAADPMQPAEGIAGRVKAFMHHVRIVR